MMHFEQLCAEALMHMLQPEHAVNTCDNCSCAQSAGARSGRLQRAKNKIEEASRNVVRGPSTRGSGSRLHAHARQWWRRAEISRSASPVTVCTTLARRSNVCFRSCHCELSRFFGISNAPWLAALLTTLSRRAKAKSLRPSVENLTRYLTRV